MTAPLQATSKPAFRDDALAGRTALVTGGGSGIGAAIAAALVRHGARVAILGRRADVLEAAARGLGALRPDAAVLALPADVRDEAALHAAVARALAEWGRLDILVNNAAGNFLCPAASLSAKGLRTVLDIDAVGTFSASRAAFDLAMREHGGAIVNISATLHYLGTPFQAHAAAAKAAVDALTRTLAVEWGGAGVRVNAIAPGPIDGTEGMRRLASDEVKAKLASAIPLGRAGSVEDVADAAVFLASDAARWITGAVLVVDGGHWLASGAALLGA